MIPIQSGLFKFSADAKKSKCYFYEIVLNGKLLGYVDSNEIETMTKKLRYLKALASDPHAAKENKLVQGLSRYMEICHVPKIDLDNCTYSLYPGLYLFTSPGRMMRPVKNLTTQQTEYIGTMEQCYLHVCVKPEEFVENVKKFFLNFPHLFSYQKI